MGTRPFPEGLADFRDHRFLRFGIECSLNRTGCYYNRAVMERFFWSPKQEWTNPERFLILEDAPLSVFRDIETFYNSQRRHQTLGDQSPHTFEAEFQANSLAGIRNSWAHAGNEDR